MESETDTETILSLTNKQYTNIMTILDTIYGRNTRLIEWELEKELLNLTLETFEVENDYDDSIITTEGHEISIHAFTINLKEDREIKEYIKYINNKEWLKNNQNSHVNTERWLKNNKEEVESMEKKKNPCLKTIIENMKTLIIDKEYSFKNWKTNMAKVSVELAEYEKKITRIKSSLNVSTKQRLLTEYKIIGEK